MHRQITNPWIVCLSAASFFFFQFLQITIFNVLKPNLMIAFDTGASTLSIVSALYFYGTVLFLIPAGILLDNLSTRALILIAMALSLVGLVIFTSANNIYIAGLGRFIIGVSGGPFCFLSTMRLASRWFPENRMAFVTGVIVSFGMVGGIIAQAPVVLLVQAYGWKEAMLANIILGLFIWLLLFLFVSDYPPGKKQEYLKQRDYYRSNGFVKGLAKVVTKTQNWYCGIFASLLNLPIFIFGALLGITYLVEVHYTSNTAASLVCSMLFVGMMVGAPIFGFMSDKLRLRKAPMLFGAVICMSTMLLLLPSGPLSIGSLNLLFFLIGFGSSSQVLAYPTVAEINPLALTGSSLGLASTLIMSGGAIFQPIVGWLVDVNYNLTLWLVIGALIMSAVAALFIRETYCRRA